MDNVKFWNRLADNYDDEVGEETTAITRTYLRKDDIVLDYGCATGAYTVALAGDVAEIRGIDISPRMIELAKEVDVAVLASGDGDFDLVVRKLRDAHGVEVEVYGVRKLTAATLIQAATRFVPIEGRLLL